MSRESQAEAGAGQALSMGTIFPIFIIDVTSMPWIAWMRAYI
jgi:hypothetical protein